LLVNQAEDWLPVVKLWLNTVFVKSTKEPSVKSADLQNATDAKVAKKLYPLGTLYAGEFCIIIVP